MNEHAIARRNDDADRSAIIFVLLLLQAAIGALETLVELALAGAAPIGAAVGLFSAILTVSLIVVAAGVVRGWRWARIAATVFEGLVLTGAGLRLLLRHGTSNGLVWLLTDVALPIAVIDLLWIRFGAARSAWERPVAEQKAGTRVAAPRPIGGSRPAPMV